MVDAIVSFAVERLGDFLIQQVVFLQGVEEDVKWLRDEFSYMQSFLRDAEEKQTGDHRVRQWVLDITNVAQDTVNVLEKFTLRIGSKSGGDTKRGLADRMRKYACICCQKADLYDVGREIEALKQRIFEISRRRETYGINNLSSGGEGPSQVHGQSNRSAIKTLRRATSYLDDGCLFVGFEDVRDKLLAELLKEDSYRNVISIYGMGGLGKTTLARELYNSSQAQMEFSCRAWVCVSEEYSTVVLLRTIIKSLSKDCTKEDLEKMDEMDLERHLRDRLKEEKYLVVVDDIWQKEAWDILKRSLPDNRNGSRVIITTRKKDIAEGLDDRSFVHRLRFLTPEESWDLFQQKLSRANVYANWKSPALQELGKQMVEKCGCLPLAIVVLGGLLAQKKGIQEWQNVKDDIWKHLKKAETIQISQLLSLSYDDLPSDLKQCFLYLGAFPEDYVIIAEKLIHLWVAESLVPNGGRRMEEIAENYLNELVDRSLVQVCYADWGKILKCKVHDLLRDLAVQKAKEMNFLDVYDPRRNSITLVSRRHAVHGHIGNYLSTTSPSNCNQPVLRSLLIFDQELDDFSIERFVPMIQKTRYLSILDLDGTYLKRRDVFAEAIGELVHLRFLGLNDTNVKEFPPTIGKLKNLQTLEALLIDRVKCRFPREISQLKNLRHLYTRPEGRLYIDGLESLETLRYVGYEEWIQIDAASLTSLRELMIERRYRVKYDTPLSFESIGKLKNLTVFNLDDSSSELLPSLDPLCSCQNLLELTLLGRIEKPSCFKGLPTSISMLILSFSDLTEDPFPVLERFPNLRNLALHSNVYFGEQMHCSSNGFPRLEFLRLQSLMKLRRLQLDDGAMPMIRRLDVINCPDLEIPQVLSPVAFVNQFEFPNWKCTNRH